MFAEKVDAQYSYLCEAAVRHAASGLDRSNTYTKRKKIYTPPIEKYTNDEKARTIW